jgi:transposase
MSYKAGIDKRQLALLPASLDEYVAEDHVCRLINAFTERLDMAALGFKYAECKSTGRRPYDPQMMLNLYIYGYMHRVRSSRRLQDEANRNVEAMWLMGGLKPDDRTICNFRRDNAGALKEAFRSFSKMCRMLGLYGGEIVATDSVKVRANNSLDNNHNKVTVGNALARIDKKIEEYMSRLDQGDLEEEQEERPEPQEIKAALERLKKGKAKYEGLKARLENESEVSAVDADARLMRSGGEGRKLDVCYNVQTVVDGKNHLIVEYEVSNCASDAGNLKAMSDKAKETLGVETIINLADAGYYDSEDIAACEGSGTTCLVAKPAPGGPKKAKGFNRGDFIYDKGKDVYICPCKNELKYMREKKHVSGREYRVYSNYSACRACEKKSECTTYKFREVLRLKCQDMLDVVDERTRREKALYRKRREIVEHCFGTVKAVWGYRQFLCRGKPKVAAEMALAYTAYNFRRVYNIFIKSRKKAAIRMPLLQYSI